MRNCGHRNEVKARQAGITQSNNNHGDAWQECAPVLSPCIIDALKMELGQQCPASCGTIYIPIRRQEWFL